MEGALADAVAPLREELQSGAGEHDAVAARLKSLVNEMAPPAGTKEVIASNSAWGSDDPTDTHVGIGTVVIPDAPQENKPYCLGVVVDAERGVLFTTTDAATVENGCAGLGGPDVITRPAPEAAG